MFVRHTQKGPDYLVGRWLFDVGGRTSLAGDLEATLLLSALMGFVCSLFKKRRMPRPLARCLAPAGPRLPQPVDFALVCTWRP